MNLLKKNNYIRYLVITFFFVSFYCLFLPKNAHGSEDCKQYTTIFLENRFDESQGLILQAEVADEPDERAIGLMNRKTLAKNKGMLFVYNYPSAPQFWMKNTFVSLDILFIDYKGQIIQIFENVPKMSEKKITAGEGVTFVLEINSGIVEKFGIDLNWTLNFSDFLKSLKPFC
jgi:uncharacterized membrane protein (UPF0127 family)